MDPLSGILSEFSKVLRGKNSLLEKVLAAYLAGGHILLEDLPGTGKTTVGRTLAKLVDGALFKRIQFTPDLLPYDITGVDVWDERKREFVFHPGPVFAHVVLADEINRTTPKVQSALLEAMAESQVTIGNFTRSLPDPFLVIATQNPVETEGTYPLPEAQKDRFMFLLKPGYPDLESEYSIVRDNPVRTQLPELQPACSLEELRELKAAAGRVHVDDRLIRCTVNLAAALREHPDTILGVSTRGALMLTAAMRSLALIKGRDYAIDQDLADLAVVTYAHRIRLRGGGVTAQELVSDLAVRELRRIRHG
ncbi:MAG: magnesium chelatase [Spirochaetes bacterium]|nr:MAG: magnesium chelatase [Spirochaetota bacterium]RKX88984.1 MAG: magnesium chelatase [Spirochaetota bacterium]